MPNYLLENCDYLVSKKTLSEKTVAILKNPPLEWLKEWKEIFVTKTLSKNNILYHSRRDPLKEAERQVENMKLIPERSHLICLGAGLGYIFYPLKEKKILSCLLLEPNLEILFYLLNFIKPEILKKINLTIHSKPVEQDNLEEILPYLQGKNVQDIKIYQHRPSFLAYPQIYETLSQRLKALLEKRAINQATIVKFQDLWNRNIFLNYPVLLNSFAYQDFCAINKTPSIVVAGAGPSLEESFSEIKKWRSYFWLFCVDTAFIPLVKNGIQPDVVFASDPQAVNRFYGFHSFVEKSIWCLDPVVNYHLTHFLLKKKAPTVAWDNPFMADLFLREITGNRGEIEHGGSISTNAFAAALHMATEKVILVGQDLSFPDKKAHVRGAALEELIFYQTNRFFHIEEHNRKQMTALPPIYLKSIQGKSVVTNAKLVVFAKWFQEKALAYQNQKPQIFNATSRGAYLANFHHAPLSEIFFNEKKQVKPPQIPKKNFHLPTEKLCEKLTKLQGQMDELYLIYHKFLTKSNFTVDEIPAHLKKANDLLSLKSQSIILRITEGGETKLGEKFYLSMMDSIKEHKALIEKVLHKLKALS